MEIKITEYLLQNPKDFAASQAELGPLAGRITWNNACAYASKVTLCSDKEHLAKYFSDFGAWADEELEAMSLEELNALLIQSIAGDIREAQALAPSDTCPWIDWTEYEELSENGQIGGRLFSEDGEVFCLLAR